MGIQKVDYKRQLRIFDPTNYNDYITIVGLGNVGSHATLTLAKLGIKGFILYDFDTIENHNLSSQAYTIKDIGKNKAIALTSKIMEINPEALVIGDTNKFDGNSMESMSKILIVAVDTMKERRRICSNMIKKKVNPDLIIDSRMGGAQLELYSCNSVEEWEKTFVDNPSTDPCGGRFICYVSIIVGALITNQIRKFLKKEEHHKSMMIDVNSLQVVTNYEW